MFVRLDHLREVIARTSKRNTLLLQQAPRIRGSGLADLVESQFAIQIVVGVGDVDWLVRDYRVVLGEWGLRGDEGDAFKSGVDGGGIVDGEALVGDYILSFVVGQIGEGNVFFVLALALIFVFICIFLVLFSLSLSLSLLFLITRLVLLFLCFGGFRFLGLGLLGSWLLLGLLQTK